MTMVRCIRQCNRPIEGDRKVWSSGARANHSVIVRPCLEGMFDPSSRSAFRPRRRRTFERRGRSRPCACHGPGSCLFHPHGHDPQLVRLQFRDHRRGRQNRARHAFQRGGSRLSERPSLLYHFEHSLASSIIRFIFSRWSAVTGHADDWRWLRFRLNREVTPCRFMGLLIQLSLRS